MGSVYKSICFEVDSLMLLVTRLAEKEVQLKIDIETMMNEGFVYIAKARFVMGSTCVTKMQLPTENSNPIKPVATVRREEIGNNWVFKIERKALLRGKKASGSGVFEGRIQSPGCSMDTSACSSEISINSLKSESAFRNMLINDPKSIRKSKDAFLIKDELYQECQDDLLDEISDTESIESVFSVTDPIRLFGVLVPNALKQAQEVFINAVNLMGECATVQAELSESLNKLGHLQYVKSLIQETAREAKLDYLTPKVYWTPSKASSVSSCYPLEHKGEDDSYVYSQAGSKSIRLVFYDDRDTEDQEFLGEYKAYDTDSLSEY